MTESDRSDIDTVSTLVLLDDKEFELCASTGRVVFANYCRAEVSLEKTITLTLDCRRENQLSSASLAEDSSVSIIVSTPSTSRFELSANDETTSPLEFVLSSRSSRTYTVKFRQPNVSESDYAWDNFLDQVVVHTRLSKLVIRLEAWKLAIPLSFSPEQESRLLFPASLPEVKAPPLRLFGAIERNADKTDSSQRHRVPSSSITETAKTVNMEAVSKPQDELLSSFSRSTSSNQQSSPPLSSRAISSSDNVAQLPLSEVTAVQSQREAREVILKLRSRRMYQSNAKVPFRTSSTAIADTELFPETIALDAGTKADLDQFNILVVAARDHVTKQTEKAKSELAYYQQILPKPPSRDSTSETPTTVLVAPKPRKSQKSAATRRPSKLPSLARLSGAASTSSLGSVDNQEIIPLEQLSSPHELAHQLSTRTTKLQSLESKSKSRTRTNNQKQEPDQVSDFDDPDPEVDDAPIIPEELSGVATLDVDE